MFHLYLSSYSCLKLYKPYKNQLTFFDSRRRFLQKSIIAASAMAIRPFKQFFSLASHSNEFPSWYELIEYARWCPTIHNLQPHKIKIISSTEAELYYDPSRLLPVEDPNSVFVTVALGVFYEHLSIAAAPYGKKVEITEMMAPVQVSATIPTLFAKLRMVSVAEKEEIKRQLMLQRRTSRLHYNGNPLQPQTLSTIKNEAASFDHEFFFSSHKEFVDYVINLNQETLFEDISKDADRRELDNLFRYSEKEARQQKDGLWSKCMCVPGALLQSVFKHPENWAGIKKEILLRHYKSLFKGTSTVGWFGGKFSTTNDWFQAGRMLARCWLLITADKAFIHPFGSLITNANAYKKINMKFTNPAEGKKIWMIFRAGYSKEPARSFRLNTDEIIIV